MLELGETLQLELEHAFKSESQTIIRNPETQTKRLTSRDVQRLFLNKVKKKRLDHH